MPLAGITGAVAVFAGLLFVDKVGAGAFNGLLITAKLLTSVAMDHFGWVGMRKVEAGPARLAGAGLMVGGIALISLSKSSFTHNDLAKRRVDLRHSLFGLHPSNSLRLTPT